MELTSYLLADSKVYFNYVKDQILILDQPLPVFHSEKTISKLYQNGKLIVNEIVVESCICKWMIDEVHWFGR